MSSLTVRDDLAEGRLRAIPVAGVDWRREFRAVDRRAHSGGRGPRSIGAHRDWTLTAATVPASTVGGGLRPGPDESRRLCNRPPLSDCAVRRA